MKYNYDFEKYFFGKNEFSAQILKYRSDEFVPSVVLVLK